MYILYNNDNNEQKYNIKAYSISDNIITIPYGDDITFPKNINGFKIFDNNTLMEDCSKFATKYNTSDIGYAIMYSSDGSTETEENKLDMHYDNYSFEDSMKEIFESAKTEKITLSKALLAEFLENNPLFSTCHNKDGEYYSVTSEKQNFMMNQYLTYQVEKAINPNAKITWNASGDSCEEWTEEEFLQLIVEIKNYVQPIVSYQQLLEERIRACTSVEELEAIEINYSQFSM